MKEGEEEKKEGRGQNQSEARQCKEKRGTLFTKSCHITVLQ